MSNGDGDREFVTALARGLSVIQAFDRDHPELTLSEAAARTGLNVATVRRCLLTLERLGYVGVQGRKFLLRPKIVTLGSAYLNSVRVEEIIQPILREIVAQDGDSASLAVLDGDDILYLANSAAKRLVRLTAGVGTRFPAYATSMGRILLADLPPEELDGYLARVDLKPLTPATITNRAMLAARIAQAKADGYVLVQDELEDGLSAVAVPVIRSGRAVAAVNCSGYRRSNDKKRTRARVALLRDAAERIAGALQHFPVLAHSVQMHRTSGF